MSGYEVIGVVLAVYPVVIDGIKLCKAVASGQGIAELVDDLKNEEIRYTEFLGCLFGIDFVKEEQARLSAGKTPAPNPTPRQQTNLERRLGKTKTDLIFSTLERMNRVLESMRADIEKARVKGLDVGYYEKASSTLRTIKFIRRKSSFRDRLVQLRKWNDRLRDQLGPQPLPSKTGSWRKPWPISNFPRQDQYAKGIFYAIRSGYECQCNAAHSARLGLPWLPSSMDRQALTAETSDIFNLLFPFEDQPEDDGASLLTIQTLQDESLSSAQLSRDDLTGGEPRPITRAITAAEDSDNRNSRRLSMISSSATMTSLTTTTTTTSSRSKISNSRSLSIRECTEVGSDSIKDLCRTVRGLDGTAHSDQKRIGVLSSNDKKYELLRTTIKPEYDSLEDTIDLEDLLNSCQGTMYRRYRFCLALRLSYAVLQFYLTPWINPKWGWKDFTTVINGNRPRNDDPLFITQNFYSKWRQGSKSETQAAMSFGFWAGVGEETLTRLGFALIELGVGRRLSELRQDGSIQPDPRMDMTSDPDILDFWTAEGVLDSGLLYEEQGKDYEEVVRVLIKHEFMENCKPKRLNSRETSFYTDVEQLVIVPLYSVWTDSWGNRASHLSL